MDKYIQDLRGMSWRDLEKKIVTLEEEYFKIRCNKKTGQLTDISSFKKIRRNIAKAKTIMTERKKEETNKKNG